MRIIALENQIAQIKQGAGILSIIGRDVSLKRVATTRGGEWAGPCPFCGGQDRLRVQPDRGLWWCRQCSPNEHWQDVIAYVQQHEGVDFQEAVSRLSEGRLSVSQTKVAPLAHKAKVQSADWLSRALEATADCERALWSRKPASQCVLTWLHQRGLKDDTLKAWRIGYNDSSRSIGGLWVESGVTIPYFDGRNTLHAINVRRPDKFLKAYPRADKYKMISGSKRVLFGTQYLNGLPDVVITEGEFDAILTWQEARGQVDVLTMGAAKGVPTETWLFYLLTGQRFYIATDNDPAGNEAARRWSELLGERSSRQFPPVGKDVTEFWQKGGDIRQWILAMRQARTACAERRQDDMPANEPSALAGSLGTASSTIGSHASPATTAAKNYDLTIDQIVEGGLERLGLRIVHVNIDLYGEPWRPTVHVEPIES